MKRHLAGSSFTKKMIPNFIHRPFDPLKRSDCRLPVSVEKLPSDVLSVQLVELETELADFPHSGPELVANTDKRKRGGN